MLSMTFARQHLRRTAAVALVAWVLALVSGLANACLLESGALDASPLNFAQRGELPIEHTHDRAEDAPAACLKFCADEASALAKSKASPADSAVPVPLASMHWQLPTRLATQLPWQAVERPALDGPPLFLRLLHLTI